MATIDEQKNEIIKRRNIIVPALKKKLGQKVLLKRRVTVDIGGSIPDPKVHYEEETVVFLGIYGLNHDPIYLHVKSEDGNEAVLLTKIHPCSIYDSDIWCDAYRRNTEFTNLDNIDIEKYFDDPHYWSGQNILAKKMEAMEPNKNIERIAKEIIDGIQSDTSSSNSRFQSPEFIKTVLRYLEKIV